ncbi:PEP-CTERM sorting domain-containing protein [Roseofilum sp. BLCC_M154]|uniref:PEP-CTERM sorting domain-containing protein n=1 Tax=Roseofilum acuticapitatum BLCC-M154 TaxID=3022444 RepID=A0ABT7AQ59_9CYAN|nr:XDD3 family exosortase-dependent surface protein [Roseofilum acuticapitatum]MDJ1168574.1 PEP-CTERM sorting domain-containing protein [Roseofilum acuticapitatum BLCC-M154]
MARNTTTHFLGTVATLGLATLFTSPAQAGTLGGTFSIFLDCNNDGMAHQRQGKINGWQFTQDAVGDNTDGPLYDMRGMATTVTEDGKVVVVMTGNTSIDGEGSDRSGNTIAWGDLFFTAGNQTFEEAQNSGNLFAINFSQANDSNAPEVGVYNSVTAQGVGMHNFGHRTYGNYMDLVDSDVTNFFGDIESNELGGNNPYYNTTGPGYNVIGQGTRAYNDGFSFVDSTRLDTLGFNDSGFDNAGTEVIAFEFNLKALTQPLPLPDQAEQLGVEWIWDDDFQAIDDEYDRLQAEQRRIWREEIKDHHEENKAIRADTPGFDEIWGNRQAALEVRNAANKRQGYLDDITETEAKIAELNAREVNDPTWNTKDEKYRKFLQDEIKNANKEIQKIENDYGTEALATAQEDWKTANRAYGSLINQIRADNPTYVANEEAMVEPNARRKEVIAERNAQKQMRKDLEQEIQGILAGMRQEIVAQADAQEQVLEEKYGVRTSASDRNATTISEFEDPVDVPEPSALAGLMLLGLGATQLRRTNKR